MAHNDGDILGHPEVPLRVQPALGRIQLVAVLLAVAAAAWFSFSWLADSFKKWQEKTYRLAMRRRHGIPDNDHRPFNVAYAAATNARKDRGSGSSADERSRNGTPLRGSSTQRNALAEGQRQRLVQADRAAASPLSEHRTGPAAYSSATSPISRPLASAQTFPEPRRQPSPPRTFIPGGLEDTALTSPPPSGDQQPSRRPSRMAVDIDASEPQRGHVRKHIDEQDGEGSSERQKKTRVDGDEMIDGDEAPEWHDGKPTRGSKRSQYVESDQTDTEIAPRRRDKRIRQAHDATEMEVDADNGESDDEVMEFDRAPATARGKGISARGLKRRQSQAASVFDGEADGDDRSDSQGDEEREKSSRHRKRRNKRKSEAVRGSPMSNGDVAMDAYSPQAQSRKSRKSRASASTSTRASEEDGDSRMHLHRDMPLSNDPLCKGRVIGEEWEANGIKYKVGPNGQRLRHAIVRKKKPTRFSMPMDSMHPDRTPDMEVYVETWLDDVEFKISKERGELAWQDSPTKSGTIEPATPGNVPDSPPKTGKNLLWPSPSSPTKDSFRRSTQGFRQSVATNVGLRYNPFQQSQPLAPQRRLAAHSPLSLPTALPSESPGRSRPAYSKWEKQELEAEAMEKMRRRALEQKKAITAGSGPSTPSSAGISSDAGSAAPSPFGPLGAAKGANPPPPTPVASSAAAEGSSAPAIAVSKPSLGLGHPSTAPPTAPAAGPAPLAKTEIKPPAINSPFSLTPSGPTTSPLAQSGGGPPAVLTPNLFAPKPTNTATATPPAPGSVTVPGQPSVPANASPFAAPSPSPAPGMFATPTSGPSATTTQPTAPAAPKPGSFAFPGASSTGGSAASSPFSLPKAAPPTINEPPKAPSPFAAPTGGSAPKFSFGPSSATSFPGSPGATAAATPSEPPKPASPFGAGANTSTAPKFSFGSPSGAGKMDPPATTTAHKSPFASAATGTLAMAVGGAGGSASPSPFGAGSVKPAEPPKPSFSFGNPAPSAPSSTTPTPAAEPPKSAFGSAPAASPFGGAPAPSPFGSTSMPSPFGNGSATAAPLSAKPTIPFGAPTPSAPTPGLTPGAAAAAQPVPAADTNKPKFSFNFGSGGGSAAPASSPFGSAPSANPNTNGGAAPNPFNFGTASKPTASSFTFGQPSQPSAPAPAPGGFGFGAPSTPSSFTFGAPAQNQEQKK